MVEEGEVGVTMTVRMSMIKQDDSPKSAGTSGEGGEMGGGRRGGER